LIEKPRGTAGLETSSLLGRGVSWKPGKLRVAARAGKALMTTLSMIAKRSGNLINGIFTLDARH
jgi:hypothetical protein